MQLVYERADDYKELAELCDLYNVSEEVFNECLEIDKHRKTRDNLSNIIINGEEINYLNNEGHETKAKGYYLLKLPIDDQKTYIVGEITNCCQSIGGHSQACVIDGVTRENNGFYVLVKNTKPKKESEFIIDGKINYNKYEIVGQGYAWLSVAGSLTFDSWENLRKGEAEQLKVDVIIRSMLQEFAKQVTKDGKISRVTVGTGSDTSKVLINFPEVYPETMLERENYGEADNQALIGQSKKLSNIIAELQKPLFGYTYQIISIKQGEKIKEIIGYRIREGQPLTE